MKISVVTVVKNSRDTIRKCLLSVKKQKYKNYEHIIIDGVSTDGTLEVLRDLIDEKSKVISREDSGLYDALNQCKDLINGEYTVLLHSDDYFVSNDVLSRVVQELRSHPNIDALFCGVEFINWKNEIVRIWRPQAFASVSYRFGWAPPHTGIILKTETYKFLLPFDTNYKISADYDFMVRFMKYSKNYLLSDIRLTRMQMGGMSTNYLNYLDTLREDFLISNRHKLFILSPILKRLYKIFQIQWF